MGEDDEMKIGLCDLDITNKLISLIAFRGCIRKKKIRKINN